MAISRVYLLNRAVRVGRRFIAYRPRSCEEVRRRLALRFSGTVVEEALQHLEGEGYLDDAAFARFWRESRESNRPRSASFICYELVRHGVGRELAQEAVAGMNEEVAAHRAGLARLRAIEGLGYVTFRRRLEGYLKRRGFGPRVTRQVVSEMWRLSHS